MAVTPVRSRTGTGTFESTPYPEPVPKASPHDHTVPSDFSAKPFQNPAATWVTPVNPDTRSGTFESPPVAPAPSWPNWLSPQDHTVPSVCSASAVWPVAATALIPLCQRRIPGVGPYCQLPPQL